MSTKNRKKNKRKFITRGHGSEPTVIEFNLSKAVLLCITIGVIITTITTVKVITTIIGAKQDNVLANENATYTYVTSSDGIQVPVPKGYVASQIPGETSVNGGFVIYEDNYNGSTIDWNSVLLDTNSLSVNSLDANSQTSSTTSNSTNETSIDATTDTELNETEEAEEDKTDTEHTPLNDATNNSEEVETTKPQNVITGTDNVSETAVVRKMNTDIGSQTWYTMYEKTKELSGKNDNAITSMIWGPLWDETLQWLYESGAKTSDGTKLTYELIGSKSTLWGNYSDSTFNYIQSGSTVPESNSNKSGNTLIPTGSSDYTKVNNIFDLTGNATEWTLEKGDIYGRSPRGGTSVFAGDVIPAGSRIIDFRRRSNC